MRAVFLDQESLDRGDLDLSDTEQLVDELICHERTEPDQVADRIQGVDIIIVNKVRLSREALSTARPRLIAVVATGVNNVDLDACRDLGITVVNVRGYGTDSVAQHAIGLLLALATRLLDYERDVREGAWSRSRQFCLLDHPIMELSGKVFGVVGLGTLGGRTAELAKALGMEVLVAQRPGASEPEPGRIPLPELLPRVDALSLHCPLTDATRGLIGRDALALMKPTAFIINTARGGLVDEEALADALREGRLGGAGFDVLTEEPPRHGNPLLDDDIPNLIVTPHSAWGSLEARRRICDQLAENIRAWQAGKPVRVVA